MVILTQALETQLFGYVDEVYQMKALEPTLVSLQTKFFQLILDTAVRNKQSKGPQSIEYMYLLELVLGTSSMQRRCAKEKLGGGISCSAEETPSITYEIISFCMSSNGTIFMIKQTAIYIFIASLFPTYRHKRMSVS